MSSDSEENDFLYTNTGTLLKQMKQKITAKVSVQQRTTVPAQDVKSAPDITDVTDLTASDSDLMCEDNVEKNKATDIEENTESDRRASDSVNIISVIDNVLFKQRKGRKRKGRGGRRIRTAVNTPRASTSTDNGIIDLVNCTDNEDSFVSQNENMNSNVGNLTNGNRRGRRRQTSRKCTLVPQTLVSLNTDTVEVSTFEEINYRVTIKVFWKSESIHKFEMQRFGKMASLFTYFAEKENIPEDRLLFTYRENIISKTDTLDSLDINAATIIEGGILSEQIHMDANRKKVTDNDLFKLKVQYEGRKQPLVIQIKPNDEMNILMCKCGVELGLPPTKLKFYFDGERIKGSDTPTTLELENGECIDCSNV